MPKCPACRVGQLVRYVSLASSMKAMVTELGKTMGGDPSAIPLLGNLVQYARDLSGSGPQSVRTQYRCSSCNEFAVVCPKCSNASEASGPLEHLDQFSCTQCSQKLIFRLD